ARTIVIGHFGACESNAANRDIVAFDDEYGLAFTCSVGDRNGAARCCGDGQAASAGGPYGAIAVSAGSNLDCVAALRNSRGCTGSGEGQAGTDPEDAGVSSDGEHREMLENERKRCHCARNSTFRSEPPPLFTRAVAHCCMTRTVVRNDSGLHRRLFPSQFWSGNCDFSVPRASVATPGLHIRTQFGICISHTSSTAPFARTDRALLSNG